MTFKSILLAVAATVALGTGAASAAPVKPVQIVDARWDRDHGRWDRGYGQRIEHRRYVSHDRVYRELRKRHFRHAGRPYFHRGHYVVRAYDRRGRLMLIRVNPYTGRYLGLHVRF